MTLALSMRYRIDDAARRKRLETLRLGEGDHALAQDLHDRVIRPHLGALIAVVRRTIGAAPSQLVRSQLQALSSLGRDFDTEQSTRLTRELSAARAAERRQRRLAQTDSLTGLVNRSSITHAQPASDIAERLRRAVADDAIEIGGYPLRVTISLGVATLRPDETAHDLVVRADTALYTAKRAGRDQVAVRDTQSLVAS